MSSNRKELKQPDKCISPSVGVAGSRNDPRLPPPGAKEMELVNDMSRIIAEFNRLCTEMTGFNGLVAERAYGLARRNVYNLMATSGAMLAMLEQLIRFERSDKGLPPISLMPWEKTPVIDGRRPGDMVVYKTTAAWPVRLIRKMFGGRT